MWADNETDVDFLNFTGVAETVSEIILQASGAPVSIGLSGAWGTGKSSMVRLVANDLEARTRRENEASPFIFASFNPWLYQGFDDARAALLEVVARKLEAEARARQSGVDKARDLLSRVNWVRAAGLAVKAGAAAAAALSPLGLAGGSAALAKALVQGDPKAVATSMEKGSEAWAATQGLLRDEESPPEGIEAIRQSFQATLKEVNATLVVFVDDLDRCLPPTTIATLEAMRLLLFMQGTAFVIAADEEMIKLAVSDHFPGAPESLVSNYFDKLVQIPIKIPSLGTHEVRAYLMLLIIQASEVSPEDKETIRSAVRLQLSESWRGKRVDRSFIQNIGVTLPPGLLDQLNRLESIAPILASSPKIGGNPRLVKRFLNALSIRRSMASTHGVAVDEATLLKLLLFERCAGGDLFASLVQRVNEDPGGKPHFLAPWEAAVRRGETLELEAPWNDPFVREWLTMEPGLAAEDLRGALYVAREHALLHTVEDRLSSAAADVLDALVTAPEVAATLSSHVRSLTPDERQIIMTKLLKLAAKEETWGTPDILAACLVVAQADARQAPLLADFLKALPPGNVKADIVPRLEDEPWAKDVFETWIAKGLKGPAKVAIQREKQRGHVSQ